MNFTNEIKKCRDAVSKCNYADAAKAIGLPKEQERQIGRWVDGVCRPGSADRVIALAKYLEVSPQALGAMFMIAWVDRELLKRGQAPVAGESSPPEVRSHSLAL